MKRYAILTTLAVTALLLSPAPGRADGSCTPGVDGCLPTPQQCATGKYNGLWDGGEAGRLAVCAGGDGHIAFYAGGTLYQPCGVIVLNDEAVAGDPNLDPNLCHACSPADTAPVSISALPPAAAPTSFAARHGAIPTDFRTAGGLDDVAAAGPVLLPPTLVEPAIAIDPNDPDAVVAAYFTADFASIGYATSADGGASWFGGALPVTANHGGPYEGAGDPSVTFGPDGAVYVGTFSHDFARNINQVEINRSDDHGRTFGPPILVSQDPVNCVGNDKIWIAADANPVSPYAGRLYAAWTRFTSQSTIVDGNVGLRAALMIRSSDDRGETWSERVAVSDPLWQNWGVVPVVQPNGDVTVVYSTQVIDPGVGSNFNTTIVAQTSRDGGRTFASPVVIDQLLGPEPQDMRGGNLAAAAVDPVTGHLYVVWPDARFRTNGLNDVLLSRSTDGGRTWSVGSKINDAPADGGLEYLMPQVAAADHFVHVTFRTRAMSPSPSDLIDTRYLVSEDDGASFGGELVLGEPSDLRFAVIKQSCPADPLPALIGRPLNDSCRFLGDYMGLAASPEVAHAVWAHASDPGDGSTPHQSIWTATVAR